MIAKKSDELHEPGSGQAYEIWNFVKYYKIELFIFQVKYAIGNKRKNYQRTNK